MGESGSVFVSYRRSQLADVASLVRRLHALGVPTWQDVQNLSLEPTADELRRVIGADQLAGAVLWITPDVPESPTILRLELPELMARYESGPFMIAAVAAGGLGYSEAQAIASTHLGVNDLSGWNWLRLDDNFAISDVAQRVSAERLRRIDEASSKETPLRLVLDTRQESAGREGADIAFGWTDYFEDRRCTPSDWQEVLLPAMAMTTSIVQGTGRATVAEGHASLPAAFALGAAYLAPKAASLAWRQFHPSRGYQDWSGCQPTNSGVHIDQIEGDLGSDDLAVLVSVNHDVQPALRASNLPTLRGFVIARGSEDEPLDLLDAAQASDLALKLVEAVRVCKTRWRGVARVHIFMSCPAGLSVLIGQQINGLGPIQTYEHVQADSIGLYEPAALVSSG